MTSKKVKQKLSQFLLFFCLISLMIIGFLFLKNSHRSKEETQDVANAIYSKCTKKYLWSSCYAASLSGFNNSHNLHNTLKVLEKLQKLDKRSIACHEIAHRISNSEISKNPTNWKEMVRVIDPEACQYGFLHGILEGASAYDSHFVLNEQSFKELVNLCADSSRKKTTVVFDTCTHILGHILLAEKLGNISESIKICGNLEEKYWFMCYTGVFMENIMRDNLVMHGIGYKLVLNEKTKNQLEALCKSYDGIIRVSCWRHMSNVYLYLYGSDIKKLYRECNNINDIASGDEYYFYGIRSAVLSLDVKKYGEVCKKYEGYDNRYTECYRNAMFGLFQISANQSKVTAFCGSLRHNFRESCQSYYNFLKNS